MRQGPEGGWRLACDGDDPALGDLLARLAEHVPTRRRLRLHKCVETRVPPSWGWREPRLIDDYHLLYLRGGRGAYAIDGRELPFAPGGVIFVGSGARHTAWQDLADPPRIISLRFGLYGAGAARGARQMLLHNSAQAYALTPAEPALVQGLFTALVAAHSGRREDEASSLLHALLCQLSRAPGREGAMAAGMDARIEKVRLQLDLHPVRRLSIDDMAVMAGLSRNYFVRLFQRETGRSPKAYQIAARMRFARYLLENSEASVQQVARDLLFPDQYAFSKQFRNFHGIPPSACR